MNLRTMFTYSDDEDVAILLAYRDQIEMAKKHARQSISNKEISNILSVSTTMFENNRVGSEVLSEGSKSRKLNPSKEDFLSELNNYTKIIDEKINEIIDHKQQLKNMNPLDKDHIQIAMSNIKKDLEDNEIDLVKVSKRMDLVGAGINKHVEDKPVKIQERLKAPYEDAFIPFMEILARGKGLQTKTDCLNSLEKAIKELSRLKNV